MASGAQFVTTFGVSPMPELCAISWDTLMRYLAKRGLTLGKAVVLCGWTMLPAMVRNPAFSIVALEAGV